MRVVSRARETRVRDSALDNYLGSLTAPAPRGEVHRLMVVNNLPKVSACDYMKPGENQSDFIYAI